MTDGVRGILSHDYNTVGADTWLLLTRITQLKLKLIPICVTPVQCIAGPAPSHTWLHPAISIPLHMQRRPQDTTNSVHKGTWLYMHHMHTSTTTNIKPPSHSSHHYAPEAPAALHNHQSSHGCSSAACTLPPQAPCTKHSVGSIRRWHLASTCLQRPSHTATIIRKQFSTQRAPPQLSRHLQRVAYGGLAAHAAHSHSQHQHQGGFQRMQRGCCQAATMMQAPYLLD